MFKYTTGKKEEESDLILRNVGLTRQHRKSAAIHLGMNFKDYQQVEEKLMSKKKVYLKRVADKCRHRKEEN